MFTDKRIPAQQRHQVTVQEAIVGMGVSQPRSQWGTLEPKGTLPFVLWGSEEQTAPYPLHTQVALEAGMLHVTDADISMLESHFQQHKDLGNPVPVPYKGGGHNANHLHPMYRMMFLKGVHVTQTGPVASSLKWLKL